jgi:hypothetical protein
LHDSASRRQKDSQMMNYQHRELLHRSVFIFDKER